ncbi:hypothetical protein SBV1_1670013 [Verrucomicrobia bacterium]|nr:hypothetical protein SBV1_1670013 [Verrucomicrobiota bacterium]
MTESPEQCDMPRRHPKPQDLAQQAMITSINNPVNARRYGIFYTVERNSAVVWAVIDLRSDPAWIREKLKG